FQCGRSPGNAGGRRQDPSSSVRDRKLRSDLPGDARGRNPSPGPALAAGDRFGAMRARAPSASATPQTIPDRQIPGFGDALTLLKRKMRPGLASPKDRGAEDLVKPRCEGLRC